MPILLLLLLVLDQINECYAVSSATPICGACSLLVNELETSISNVNANKKIQIGSFRVDPKGNQNGLNEVPFARSEAHIYDLLEDICAKSRDYVLVVNPTTGKAVYRRADLTKLDGDKSRETLTKLESACGDFLDDHEEELIEFVRTAHPEPIRQFCHQQTGVCTSVDVTPFPAADTSDDEKSDKSADDEKPDKSSADEKPDKSLADDEKPDKSPDDEKTDKSSADDKKPDKSSDDEKTGKSSADDKKPDKSSDDEKPDKSPDDKKPDKSIDDEKPDKSADEKTDKSLDDEKPGKSSDDEKTDKSLDDEKPDKSSDDEKLDKSLADEKPDEKATDDDGTDSEKKKTIDNGSDGGVGDKDEL